MAQVLCQNEQHFYDGFFVFVRTENMLNTAFVGENR